MPYLKTIKLALQELPHGSIANRAL